MTIATLEALFMAIILIVFMEQIQIGIIIIKVLQWGLQRQAVLIHLQAVFILLLLEVIIMQIVQLMGKCAQLFLMEVFDAGVVTTAVKLAMGKAA